jgi:hypothetical protein
MMGAEVVVPTIEFPCEPWLMRNETEIQPVPGTWTLAPLTLRQKMGVKGIISCPSCGNASLLLKDSGEKADRPVDQLFKDWHCRCGHVCNAILLDWDKRKLYCVVYETFEGSHDSPRVIPHKEYLHAESDVEAKALFWAGHPNECINLVDAAPVIGFFVLDNEGRKLTV